MRQPNITKFFLDWWLFYIEMKNTPTTLTEDTMEYPNITKFFTVPSKSLVHPSVTDSKFRDMLFDLYCFINGVPSEDPEVQKLKDGILKNCFVIIDRILSTSTIPHVLEIRDTISTKEKFRFFIEIFRAWAQLESDNNPDPNKILDLILVPKESPINTKH